MRLHQKLFWLLVFLLPLQLGRHFWPPSSLVLGLRVDYLAPTIYLTDILVVGILGLWGWEMRNTKYVIRNTLRRYWWVLIIFIYLLTNALLAQNSGAAIYKFIKIVEFGLLGLYVAKNRYTLSSIRYPLTLAVAYSSIIAIMQFFLQSSLGGPFWWLGERTFSVATPGIAKAIINGQLIMRPYGTFPHPNVLAGFLLISLILTFPYFEQSEKQGLPYLFQKNKLFAICYLLFTIFAIVLSFSRSVWIVGLLICLWLVIQWWRKIKVGKKSMFYVLCSMLFVVGLLVYFGPHFSTNEAFFQRWQLMKTAWLMINSSLLTGMGLNNFIVRLPDYWPVTGFTYWLQPVHNIYLLIAAETGLIGLVVFIWLLILTYKRSLFLADARKKRSLFLADARKKKLFHHLCTMSFVLCTSLTVILLLGFVDHYWLTLQQTQLLFAIVLGLSWAKH